MIGKWWNCVAINASEKVINFTFCNVKWKRRETQMRQQKKKELKRKILLSLCSMSWTCQLLVRPFDTSCGMTPILLLQLLLACLARLAPPHPKRFIPPVPPLAKDPHQAHLPLSLLLRATVVSASPKSLPTQAEAQKNVTFLGDFNLSPHCELSR